MGVTVELGGDNLPSPVVIELTDLTKVPLAPLPPGSDITAHSIGETGGEGFIYGSKWVKKTYWKD